MSTIEETQEAAELILKLMKDNTNLSDESFVGGMHLVLASIYHLRGFEKQEYYFHMSKAINHYMERWGESGL